MAEAQKPAEEQKPEAKLNKDGFPAGQRVDPKQLAEFRRKQRQKK